MTRPPAASADTASSKSRAVTGSIVNVGRSRRSRRCPPGSAPPDASDAPSAPDSRASRSTAGSKAPCRPRSSIRARITSRAISGRPSRRATVARRDPPRRPLPCPVSDSTTRSPTPARLSRLTTTRGPGPKNGSATRNFPWRTSSATRAAASRVHGPGGRRSHCPSSAATVCSATVSAVSVLAVAFVNA